MRRYFIELYEKDYGVPNLERMADLVLEDGAIMVDVVRPTSNELAATNGVSRISAPDAPLAPSKCGECDNGIKVSDSGVVESCHWCVGTGEAYA